jgi:hypothetical protein
MRTKLSTSMAKFLRGSQVPKAIRYGGLAQYRDKHSDTSSESLGLNSEDTAGLITALAWYPRSSRSLTVVPREIVDIAVASLKLRRSRKLCETIDRHGMVFRTNRKFRSYTVISVLTPTGNRGSML